MAEAVGLAASVLSLAQTAWLVTKGLYDLADQIGSAGEAVRVFANDFEFFVENLRTLGKLLDDLPPVPRRAESTTEELLEVALEQVVQPFQSLLTQLEPLLINWRNSPSRMRQLGLRIRWAFSQKSKVLFYHAALNALKGNVSLLLQTISLQSQNPPHITFILYHSIQDTRLNLQHSRNQALALLATRNDPYQNRLSLLAGAEHESASISAVGTISDRSRSGSPDRLQATTELAMVLVTGSEYPEAEDDIAESVNAISLLAPDNLDGTEADQEQRAEQLEAFGTIRAVQKKVIRLADDALSTASSSAEPLHHPGRPESGQALSQIKPFLSKEPRKSPDEDGVIYFQDPLGWNLELPYRYVRTWKAFIAFITNLHSKSNVQIPKDVLNPGRARFEDHKIREAISYHDYTILFSEDRNPPKEIFGLDWDRSVKPGWKVELKLDDRDFHPQMEASIQPNSGMLKRALMAALEADRGTKGGS